MYELIQISEHGWYIDCPAKIGMVTVGNNEAILIDSGNDKSAAKKVRGILEKEGLSLRFIVNTHSHADHIGGNRWLQEQTGCDIFAPGMDAAMTAYPLFEPSLLYGGNPPKALRHKFLLAQDSRVRPLEEAALPAYMEIIPLSGHTPDMVGFRVDNAVFLADCLSSAQTLEKYRIGYLWDVEQYLDTLENVKALRADRFIPSHAPATEDIRTLAQLNISTVNDIAAAIITLCEQPIGFDDLLKALFEQYNLTMTAEQHALVGSTVKSYLSWLVDSGRICVSYDDNVMMWRAV